MRTAARRRSISPAHPSVNGVPLFQRPLDASVMSLLRRLVHLRSITFFHSVRSRAVELGRLRGHPGVEQIVDQGSIDDRRWRA